MKTNCLPPFMLKIPKVKNANRHTPFSTCLQLYKYKLRERPNVICNGKVNKQAHSPDICGSVLQVFLFTKDFHSARTDLHVYGLQQVV